MTTRLSFDALLAQAIQNNAVWCDTVCRSHGRPGTFAPHVWVSQAPTPRFYPNVVTLSGRESAGAQLATITALTTAGRSHPWAVKDSYAALDLAPLGFRPLFDASWIGRAADLPLPPVEVTDVIWEVVRNPAMLADGEAAWSAMAAPPQERVFRPSLLVDPAVAIIAGVRDGRIIGGVITNQSGSVVGVSNLFVPAGSSLAPRSALLAAVVSPPSSEHRSSGTSTGTTWRPWGHYASSRWARSASGRRAYKRRA